MIDYSQFGAQLMPGSEDDDELTRRRQAVQQPAGATIPTAGEVQQPAPPQTDPRASQPAASPTQPAVAQPTQAPTFAQLQAAGIARPAPPPAPIPSSSVVAQGYPSSNLPPSLDPRASQPAPSPAGTGPQPYSVTPDGRGQYSNTTGISVLATPDEASHFGANTDKGDLRGLYNAMESYNATMPNYGRNPEQVMQAYRSSDPQLQALGLSAIKQLTPESAFSLLNDQEFQSIYGRPKSATAYGARQAEQNSLNRTGAGLVGMPSETGAFLGDPFADARDYYGSRGMPVRDDYQSYIAQLLGAQPGARNGLDPSSVDLGPRVGQQAGSPVANGGLPQLDPRAGQPGQSPVANGQPQGQGNGSPLGGQIQDILRQLLSNPTAYGTDAMQREYQSGARQIDDDYTLQQKRLNEEMARRGLYDSSIAAGNLSDLNIGKRSAQTELMDRLLMKRADSQDSGIRSALSAAMGYDSDLSDRGFRNSSLDFDKYRYAGDSAFRDKQFDYQKDQDLNSLLQAWYALFGGTDFA